MITDKNEPLGLLTKSTTIKTRYTQTSPPRTLTVKMNFAFSNIEDLLNWAVRERVIALQSQLRKLPSEEAFDAFHELGPEVEVLAVQCSLPITNHTTLEDLIENAKKQ